MTGRPTYDVDARMRAAELYEEGLGRAAIASLLGIPEETVRKWLYINRAVGIEGLTGMG